MILRTKKLKKVGGTNQLIKSKKLFKLILILFFFINFPSIARVIDYEIEELLKKITNPILLASNIKLQEPGFIIILNRTPNAFIGASNRIYITTGLFSEANNPEEISGVLAHEIGHVQANHLNKRISKITDSNIAVGISNFLSLSASILSNDPNIFIGTNISSSEIMKSGLSNYSKDQEREADILAMQYLEKSKISTRGLESILKKMILVEEKMGIKEKEINIFTHPYKIERVKSIKKFQENSMYNDSIFSENIRMQFKFIKAKIDGYTLSLENNKLKYYNPTIDYDKYALSISYAREGYIEESLNYINDLIKIYPNNPFFYETKGEILLNFGYSDEANKFFKKSLELNNSNDYLRIKIINHLFNNLKVNNNAEKKINEFHLISINTDNNIKLLEIISKTQEFIGNEDWMYLYLALIEINKKNIELAKKYLNLSENVTNNSKIIKKIKELERELKSE